MHLNRMNAYFDRRSVLMLRTSVQSARLDGSNTAKISAMQRWWLPRNSGPKYTISPAFSPKISLDISIQHHKIFLRIMVWPRWGVFQLWHIAFGDRRTGGPSPQSDRMIAHYARG